MTCPDVSVPVGDLIRCQPSERVKALVRSILPPLLHRAGTRRLYALAVVGSAARGEETWRDGELLGDIDLAAVVRWPDPVTNRRILRAGLELGHGVSLGYFPASSLSRYRTIEFYEAKRTAWVVWGDTAIFERVRVAEAQDIPKWEGLRLVLNRAMECLRARAGLVTPWYAAVKTYLALGEADLVFRGRYVPSYRARLHELEKAGSVLGSAELLDRVRWATHLKLSHCASPVGAECSEYEEWLIDGLETLQARYLGREVALERGFGLVASTMRHPVHRLAYLALHPLQPGCWLSALRRDPAFIVWRRALQVIAGRVPASNSALRVLLADWERTLQPLPE